jgi:hypothetical protein
MVVIRAYVEVVCHLGLFHTLTDYIGGTTILLATGFFGQWVSSVTLSGKMQFVFVITRRYFNFQGFDHRAINPALLQRQTNASKFT